MSNYVYDPNALYHSGKSGMKWGYNDGKANGKRKAKDRYDNARRNMMKFVDKYVDEYFKEDYAWKRQDRKDARMHEANKTKYHYAAKKFEKERDTAGSIGYKVGFAAGRISRGASHITKYAKVPLNTIKQTASKGVKWLEKKKILTDAPRRVW